MKFRIVAIAMTLTVGLNATVFADSVKDSTRAVATTPADENLRPSVVLARQVSMDAGVSRPMGLPALYVTFVALQGFDIYSTNKALANGGRVKVRLSTTPVAGAR